jgi:hypothetical protein
LFLGYIGEVDVDRKSFWGIVEMEGILTVGEAT